MRIAFYKGKQRLFNRFVCWWTNGPYSHCEVVFDAGPGLVSPALCASSSFMDGGVRFKVIDLDPEKWDVIDVPALSQEQAYRWFHENEDAGYDLIGLLSTSFPIRHSMWRYFCNEAVGAAGGLQDAWRFNPTSFARVCELLGGRWIQGGPPWVVNAPSYQLAA